MKVYANSVEVAHQIDADGVVLVRASGGIAAGETIRWRVRPAANGSVFTPQVWITDTGTYYEMDNGTVAARIPKSIPCAVAATFPSGAPELRATTPTLILAPIQGFRHCDGTWTGTGPNYLYAFQAWNEAYVAGSFNYPATAPATIEVIESGPLRAKVRVTYSGLRPRYHTGTGDYVDGSYDGYYICTITLEAGQNAFLIENEANGRINWHVDMNTGVSGNRGRCKMYASSTVADGHDYSGAVLPQDSAYTEGEVNLNEGGTRGAYNWAGDNIPTWDGVWYRGVDHWWEWSYNTGLYWYVYNSAGSSSSNMWGVTQGRSDYNQRSSEAGIYGTPSSGVPTELGFYTFGEVDLLPGGGVGTPCFYGFNIFFGSKGVDVPVDFSAKTPDLIAGDFYVTNPSTGAKVMAFRSGTGQAWKQEDWRITFPDPAGGYPGMHLTRTETEALIANLEADQSPGSYYMELYNGDTGYRPIWEAYANISGTNAEAIDLAEDTIAYFCDGLDILINRGSHYTPGWFYMNGGIRFQQMAIKIMALVSLNQVRPFATALQEQQTKAILSMIGHITWDNNFVPMDNSVNGQFNYGTANMPVQFSQQRNQFAAVLRTHPQFTERFASVLSSSISSFVGAVNAYGAPKDCPHYVEPLVVPILDVFRQLQVSDYADVFATDSSIYGRLVLFGEYLLQVMTPPQSRFKKAGVAQRKMVCYGDGASEGHNFSLDLIMGLKDSDPVLAARLAWGWEAMGRRLNSFYSSSGLKITPTVATADPLLDDDDIRGFATIMRCGWETADESAVFLLHGDANVDHSNNERGSPSLYLLSEPVCVTFGSMYTPYTYGPWDASTYIPVSKLDNTGAYPGGTWNTYTDLNLSCGDHSTLFNDTYTHLFTPIRGDVTCAFAVSGWTRKMTFYKDDLTCPVVRFRDDDATSGDSVYTIMMMATGAVTKPDASTMTPLTVGGTPFPISNGAQFRFVGQWGVSWDFYYFGPTAEAFIGVYSHTWHPGTEESEYANANAGAPFEEKQYILRIKTAGPCDTVIVPYRTRPAGLDVAQTTGGLNLVTTATIGTPRFLAD